MHDLGRLGLLKAYPRPYAIVLNGVYETVGQILHAERLQFQVDHCEAGLWLMRSWGFPEELQLIAAQHHSCCFSREQGMVGLAGAACLMAGLLGFQSVNCSISTGIAELIEDIPGEPDFDVEELRGNIVERLQALGVAA